MNIVDGQGKPLHAQRFIFCLVGNIDVQSQAIIEQLEATHKAFLLKRKEKEGGWGRKSFVWVAIPLEIKSGAQPKEVVEGLKKKQGFDALMIQLQ